MSLFHVVDNIIPQKILSKRNAKKDWAYGYDKEYDIVIISKDGTIGDIYNIQNLLIALPAQPKKIDYKYNKWRVEEFPKELSRIKTQFDWNRSCLLYTSDAADE